MREDMQFKSNSIQSRIKVNALNPMGIYQPLEKRIGLLMSNISSGQDGVSNGSSDGLDNKEV